MRTNPSAHRGFAGETDIMSSNQKFTPTAIAALAGLALATTTALAIGIAESPTQAPVTGGEADAMALVLEVEEADNSNDSVETAGALEAPVMERFAIKGELRKTDADGQCRDNDYFKLTGLSELGAHNVALGGEIADQMRIDQIDPEDGSVIDTSTEGELLITTNASGEAWIKCTSNTDATDPNPHGLCGSYHLLVEISGFRGADVNGDSLVDISDVRLMLSLIGSTDSPNADLNNDGIVDAADLRILADEVNDRRAQKLAIKRAKKLEKQAAKAERQAAKRAAKAARKAEREAERHG